MIFTPLSIHGERSRPKRGFTLIELLVVVSIIAILASMLLPVLSSAKLKAWRVGCANHLRQLGMALQMHVNDNDEYVAYSAPNNSGGTHAYGTLADNYAKSRDMLICPATNSRTNKGIPFTPGTQYQGKSDLSWRGPPQNGVQTESSYCFNGWLFACRPSSSFEYDPYGGGYPDWQYCKPSNIRNSAQTPTFSDGIWNDAWPTATSPPAKSLYDGAMGPNPGGPGGGMTRVTIDRHSGKHPSRAERNLPSGTDRIPGRINMVFADGHTELVDLNGLWTYEWHKNWKTPTQRPPTP